MVQDKHFLEERSHEPYLKDALGNVTVFFTKHPSFGTSSWFSVKNHPPVNFQQYGLVALFHPTCTGSSTPSYMDCLE